jgi:amino acid adenylation domain-containing protein
VENIEDIYELAPMQAGMLFDGLSVGNMGMYRVFSAFKLHGDLDVATFRRAWQYVADRHAAIRTSIHYEGIEKPLQVVHREVELPVELIDIQHMSAAEQDDYVRCFMQEERARPYDLGSPPLMRLVLFVTGPRSFWFLWVMQHILLEGWSVSIVLQEALETYRALRRGATPALPPVRPYRDFILWIQQRDSAESEAFWRCQLAGLGAPTPLPGGRGTAQLHSAVENYAGRKLELGRSATVALEAFAREHRLTMNTLMRAAWSQVLARYTGERDLLFGTLVSGRSVPLEGIESIVGLCVNLVPVRMRVDHDRPLLDWLKEIQAQQAEMSLHEYCGLAQIKRWSEFPGSMPLFETLMIFENWAGSLDNWQGIAEVGDFLGGQIGQGYPITLVIEPGEQLAFGMLYDERRIDEKMVLRLLDYLRLVAESLPGAAAGRVGDLPLLAEAERPTLLGEWCGPGSAVVQNVPAYRAIEAQAAIAPDAVALFHEGRALTYRALDDLANRLAHHLRDLGVGPERIVGVCLDRAPELIVALLAVHKAGGAYLPLDPRYPTERLAFMLVDAGVDIVVSNAALQARIAAAGRHLVLLDRDAGSIAARPSSAPPVAARGSDLAYVIYTSGSTGMPKGVMIEHRSLATFTDAAIAAYGIGPEDRVLQFASVNFDAAAEEIFPTLARGGTLVLRTDAMLVSIEEFLRRCAEWRITVLDLPTAFWHEMTDAVVTRSLALPHTLRLVIIGGEAARPERVAQWHARFGRHPRLLNTYGPTEATVVATLQDLSTQDAAESLADRSVPIGRAMGPALTYVLDDRRQPVPIGAVGELYLGGVGLARGYLNRPDLTAERFFPDPFAPGEGARIYRTGDLARFRDDGAIEYCGRVDQQVKLRGHRVELGEIEAVLAGEPTVRDAVVILREDLAGSPGLVAYVVQRDGATPDADGLRTALRRHLPDFMVPRAFVFLDTLPLSASGKLDRRRLPPPDASAVSGRNIVAPQSDLQRRVANIWREVLGVEKIGLHDNFFDIGGHSLLLLRVHAMLTRDFQRELSYVDLFDHTTVHSLAELLGEDQPRQPGQAPAAREEARQAGQHRLRARRARLAGAPGGGSGS